MARFLANQRGESSCRRTGLPDTLSPPIAGRKGELARPQSDSAARFAIPPPSAASPPLMSLPFIPGGVTQWCSEPKGGQRALEARRIVTSNEYLSRARNSARRPVPGYRCWFDCDSGDAGRTRRGPSHPNNAAAVLCTLPFFQLEIRRTAQ